MISIANHHFVSLNIQKEHRYSYFNICPRYFDISYAFSDYCDLHTTWPSSAGLNITFDHPRSQLNSKVAI